MQVNVVMGHDLSTPLAIHEMERIGAEKVFDPAKIVLVPDHFTPNKDVKAAEGCKRMGKGPGNRVSSITTRSERWVLPTPCSPNRGLCCPGDVVVGGDSHTCSYGALNPFATGIGSTDLAAAMLTGCAVAQGARVRRKPVFYGEPQPWVGAKDLIPYAVGSVGVDGALYQAMEFTGEVIDRLSRHGQISPWRTWPRSILSTVS